jgi:hypothetical protein
MGRILHRGQPVPQVVEDAFSHPSPQLCTGASAELPESPNAPCIQQLSALGALAAYSDDDGDTDCGAPTAVATTSSINADGKSSKKRGGVVYFPVKGAAPAPLVGRCAKPRSAR